MSGHNASVFLTSASSLYLMMVESLKAGEVESWDEKIALLNRGPRGSWSLEVGNRILDSRRSSTT